MKPRLREDVHFVQRPPGGFVIVPSRADLGFRLAGYDTLEWLRRIGPFLTGEHTVDDLGAGLDEVRRSRFRSLIALLHREGAVRDATDDLPHCLSDDVRTAYDSVIRFLARGADSPEYRFQRYRESNPVVVGAGRLVVPLITTLLLTGVARVRLVVTPERPTDLVRLRECVLGIVGSEAQERLEVLAECPTWEKLLATAGAVLHVSDVPMTARVDLLARLCAEQGLVFGEATVVSDRGVVGPVQPADRAGSGGPEPHGLRVRDLPDLDVTELLAGPAAAVIANHLCVEFLHAVAGLPSEAAGRPLVIDLRTLQTTAHSIAAPTTAPEGATA